MPLEYMDNYDISRHVNYMSGRFRPNGASAIDNTLNEGRGFTATRTGVGLVSLKILIPCRAILDVDAKLWLPALIARRIELRNAPVKGASDGLFTVALVLTDLNNAGPVAVEFSATSVDYWVTFRATLQLGSAA